ncbi:hypothetical protein MATL_G00025180 [Megalops atlanticus]|uniref:Uncharacterized protein n=1 Tax=Megalops atlanticus TaxID=7932 RepID=A0A9D3QD69_MEGAT|nr:hypothetical protein MATL_G00025180 [Megalops atlanticus]
MATVLSLCELPDLAFQRWVLLDAWFGEHTQETALTDNTSKKTTYGVSEGCGLFLDMAGLYGLILVLFAGLLGFTNCNPSSTPTTSPPRTTSNLALTTAPATVKAAASTSTLAVTSTTLTTLKAKLQLWAQPYPHSSKLHPLLRTPKQHPHLAAHLHPAMHPLVQTKSHHQTPPLQTPLHFFRPPHLMSLKTQFQMEAISLPPHLHTPTHLLLPLHPMPPPAQKQ